MDTFHISLLNHLTILKLCSTKKGMKKFQGLNLRAQLITLKYHKEVGHRFFSTVFTFSQSHRWVALLPRVGIPEKR